MAKRMKDNTAPRKDDLKVRGQVPARGTGHRALPRAARFAGKGTRRQRTRAARFQKVLSLEG